MKKLTCLITMFAVLFMVSMAFAEPVHSVANVARLWNNYAGTASTATYSTVVKADRNTKKSFILVGYSSAGVDQLTTLPGTAVIQTGPTSTGPWVTAKDVNGNSMSVTATAPYLIDTLNQWYRIMFTKTATNTKGISAWVLTAE